MSERVIGIQASAGWRAVRTMPSAAVRRFVAGAYVGWSEDGADGFIRREVPQCFVPVIVNFATPFGLANAGEEPQHLSSFMAGAHDRHTMVAASGSSHCLQFNLTYDGALRLFGLPMHELANRSVALDQALGLAGRQLIERLGNAGNWGDRFDLLDEFLAQRLPEARGISAVVSHVLANAGERSVGALAAEMEVSRKRLLAEFRRDVGLGPKTVFRLHRFALAASLLRQRRDLAHVALDSGYCDQAHFNRDFRRFTGTTPLDYLAEQALH